MLLLLTLIPTTKTIIVIVKITMIIKFIKIIMNNNNPARDKLRN